MDFYLTKVMTSHGAFNVYLFHMRPVECPKYTKCNRRKRDDDDGHTLLVSSISTVLGRCDDHLTRDERTTSYTGQLGPNHARELEK